MEETKSVAVATIQADQTGLLKPTNIEDAYRLAKAYHQSKLLPQRFNTPEMIMTGMQFAIELGLKPMTALRQIAVIQGTPSLYGDLPLSLCYSAGKLEWIKEYYFDSKGQRITVENGNIAAEAFGAVCIVKRKGDSEPLESAFTLEDAKRANLMKNPVWSSYPKRMLRYRARSQALKDKFPDCLNGVAIAEYDFDAVPDLEPVTETTGATPKEQMKQDIIQKLKVKPKSEPIPAKQAEVAAKQEEIVDAEVIEEQDNFNNFNSTKLT